MIMAEAHDVSRVLHGLKSRNEPRMVLEIKSWNFLALPVLLGRIDSVAADREINYGDPIRPFDKPSMLLGRRKAVLAELKSKGIGYIAAWSPAVQDHIASMGPELSRSGRQLQDLSDPDRRCSASRDKQYAVLAEVAQFCRPVDPGGGVGESGGPQLFDQLKTEIAIAEDPVGIHGIAVILRRKQMLDRAVFGHASTDRVMLVTVKGNRAKKLSPGLQAPARIHGALPGSRECVPSLRN